MGAQNEKTRNGQEAGFRDTSAGVSASNEDTTQSSEQMQKRIVRRDVFTPASRIVDAVDNGYRWAALVNLALLIKVVFVYVAKGAGDAK